MAERALVTGGTGFIGLNLARTLVERGASVTLLDNFFRGKVDRDVDDLTANRGVRVVEHDLRQPLPDDLPGGPFTHVYHLAAIVGVRFSNEVPHEVLRTNLLATINVLDWCARNPPRTVCLSSTSEVADGAARAGLAVVPTSESSPFVLPEPGLPRASYALSKMASEQLVAHYARACGFAARILRYHNVYGPRMGYEHVVPQLVERIRRRRDPFVLYGAQQSRAFCFIDDAVEATLAVARLDHPEPLTVNIGDDREELRILHLAQRLFAIASFWPALDMQPPPPGSPERRRPDIGYLQRLTGFRPRVSLDAGLQRTYAWYTRQSPTPATTIPSGTALR
jgi:UDP-glucose 4-epimerase/UDP-glucuronate decarboxylase